MNTNMKTGSHHIGCHTQDTLLPHSQFDGPSRVPCI
jgi:hypothetical protein